MLMSGSNWFRKVIFCGVLAALTLSLPVMAEEAAEQGTEQGAEQVAEESTESGTSKAMDEELIGQILDALDNETYRSTRELLKGGEVVASGYRGDAGSGVQQMLVDLGSSITVDGIVGEKTMAALHEVQEGFGLPVTDSVDLAQFDTLLPLALLVQDNEEAGSVLYDYYEAVGDGYYDYMRGCALFEKGLYYQAKEAFESSGYGNSEERAAACVQAFPENGEIWHNPAISSSDSSLTFVVNSSDESQGMCFQMFNADGQSVSALFIKGAGSATVYVPVGTYRVRDCTGYEWYGVIDTFGPSGYYEYLTFSEDPDTMYDAYLDYGAYELTINVSEIAEGATSVGATGEGWEGAGAFETS